MTIPQAIALLRDYIADAHDNDELLGLRAKAEQVLLAEAERLREALEASVKLQSHYANLLNMHDGGERIGFKNADAWLERLAITQRTR